MTLTQEEWDAVGKHGVAQIPRNKRGIAFGMLLEPLGEADRAYMMRTLPAPVRMLYPFLIERPWKKYASALRTGTWPAVGTARTGLAMVHKIHPPCRWPLTPSRFGGD